MTALSIVVPCYNEQEALPETARQLAGLLDGLAAKGVVADTSAIYFVDDGSRDRTWATIQALAAQRPDRFRGIKLSRNRGHQSALLAGLLRAPGDAVITIDADLQDDIGVIETMVERFKSGCDIVYGVRQSRETDTAFKRRTALAYYGLLRSLGVEIVPDHADFRLMSRRAIAALSRYSEVNLFIRAIIPQLGFKSAMVHYSRRPRMLGESKYPFSKMLNLAINGITSFSMRPLRVITVLGLVISFFAFLVSLWALEVAMLSDRAVPGWASILVPLALLGGLQLFSLGVIGEYVGKIYLEVKRRPLFEVEEVI